MYDYYTGTNIKDEYANEGTFTDSIKLGRDIYTEGGYGMPYGMPGRHGMPSGRYGMPGIMPFGAYTRRGRRFKDFDFSNFYIAQPHTNFFETRKIIRNSLRAKYPKMSDLKLNIYSFGKALIQHPYRSTVANISYNPTIIETATKQFKKYY